MNTLFMDAFDEFANKWALATAGTMEDHNSMTIGWGGVGCIWGKQVATVYIRPNRHTYSYFEKNEYFTVSFYPDDCKKALGVMGKLSGRDCDKDKEAGLSPIPCGETVTYQQARRTLLCRKLYWQDMELDRFPEDVKERYYGVDPVHRMYIGEIIEIL